MAKIAVLYCKKVKDHSCIACAKCYKGMGEKNGEFAMHDDIELVGMTDCGGCPGLTVPKVKLLSEITWDRDQRLVETARRDDVFFQPVLLGREPG